MKFFLYVFYAKIIYNHILGEKDIIMFIFEKYLKMIVQ